MKQRNIGLGLLIFATLIAFFVFINKIGSDTTWRVYASGISFCLFLGLTISVWVAKPAENLHK
jgi:heme/copper-type cytochrome/quinol oxidase subunit 4